MKFQARPYQGKLKSDIYAQWGAGVRNVCAVLPTGGGKTVVFSDILREHRGAACAIAHRRELVGQMALALARCEVPHRVIGPMPLLKYVIAQQNAELGRSWFNPSAQIAVASVDTIINRGDALAAWLPQVTLWVQDEAHHVLQGNKWGKAAAMFPNARGLGVTATPIRADGYGLGRHADGVFDSLVEGPTMRELIADGYLTDYDIRVPPNDVELARVEISESTGDYKAPQLKKAVRESHVVGDIVQHYLPMKGKLAVVFATDVETATDIARQFVAAGVVAEVVSAETDARMRDEVIRRFRQRRVDVLVNVDLFGEGFDLPTIEIDVFGRPTASFAVYAQQFGRALRPVYAKGFDLTTRAGRLAAIAASDKPVAIINDHVGNVLRHGLPDRVRVWSLDRRERRSKGGESDELALRSCPSCTRPYERFRTACPYCGHAPVPAGRGAPEFVDGDLVQLDAETLARLRGEVAAVDSDAREIAERMRYAGASDVAINSMLKNHRARQTVQTALRESMQWWAGYMRTLGMTDEESYKRFFLTFGIDVLSAQALGKPEALTLADKINTYIGAKV